MYQSIARGTGYLVQNPDVVREVNARFPYVTVQPDGSWEAVLEDPKPDNQPPCPWGHDVVVYCVNQDFFPGLTASLRSLLHFHPELPVVIISWDLTPSQQLYLSRFATVIPRRSDLPDDPTWGRLGVFHLDVRRAVYLDADTVVLKPLNGLLQMDSPFAAAPNLDWGIKENFSDLAPLLELGLDPFLPAFNAGVFAADIRYWGTGLYDELLDLHSRYGSSFLLADQSALQLAFNLPDHPFTWLPVAYNTMAEFWDWEADPSTPALIHYAGPEKPWIPGCSYPAQEHFFRWSVLPTPNQLRRIATGGARS